MGVGTEEALTTRIKIPVNKEVQPLIGQSADLIAKNGFTLDFDLSDGKSKGTIKISPSPENVKEFRPSGQATAPLVSVDILMTTKDAYLVTVKKTNGEVYTSVGNRVGKDQREYALWKRVDEGAREEPVLKTPPFSSLEIQGAGFIFHKPAQRVIGAKGWQ